MLGRSPGLLEGRAPRCEDEGSARLLQSAERKGPLGQAIQVTVRGADPFFAEAFPPEGGIPAGKPSPRRPRPALPPALAPAWAPPTSAGRTVPPRLSRRSGRARLQRRVGPRLGAPVTSLLPAPPYQGRVRWVASPLPRAPRCQGGPASPLPSRAAAWPAPGTEAPPGRRSPGGGGGGRGTASQRVAGLQACGRQSPRLLGTLTRLQRRGGAVRGGCARGRPDPELLH